MPTWIMSSVAREWWSDTACTRASSEDQPTYGGTRAAKMYGVPMDALPELDPALLEADATLRFGTLDLEVRHTPGHAPGHVVFIDHAGRAVVAGTCSSKAWGARTCGGDAQALATSIAEVLYALPDDYRVCR